MTRTKSWTLTDVSADIWQENFAVGNNTLSLHTPHDWQIRKRILRGGLRDGVELIEVHNGALAFSILPTRGMGLWRGDYHGNTLGWRSPVNGPVHPRHVPLRERGECGFLYGFDEWLCRCGVASNGPPGEDVFTDASGRTHRESLTLHGRISNLPAELVEVKVNLDPPHELSVTGVVDESALFSPQLRLTTTYTTIPGSNRLVVHDVIDNRSAHPAEMQLLYHCNLGPPFLEPGARVLTPFRQVAPQTEVAAKGIDTLEAYAAPTVGFAEQVFLYELIADGHGQTLAALINNAGDRCVVLRFNLKEFPCFTVWKQTGALEEGYVTGLEPATNYPNFKTFERQHKRVPVLLPGGRWEARMSIEVYDNRSGVTAIQTEIAQLQALARAVVHRKPQPEFSPAGQA
jgi:hypothetical protein